MLLSFGDADLDQAQQLVAATERTLAQMPPDDKAEIRRVVMRLERLRERAQALEV